MKLEEFVLTKRDIDGVIVVNLEDYYENYIKPLDKRFEKCSWYNSNTVTCFIKSKHVDNDPSLGMVNHKHLQGVKLYHCFGCGSVGNVIRMHQIVQAEYHNRHLSEKESALDLCKLYNLNPLEAEDESIVTDSFSKKLISVNKGLSAYTIKDFTKELQEYRFDISDVDVLKSRVNSVMIKAIATRKGLYDR